MTIESLVKQFVEDEKFTLKNALTYAGLGLSHASGEISEIVTDIDFHKHAYSDERKDRMADILGKIAFCYHMLVATTGYTSAEIKSFFVNEFLIKSDKVTEEIKASFLELMKHIKTDVKTRDKLQFVVREHERLQNEQTRHRQHDQV